MEARPPTQEALLSHYCYSRREREGDRERERERDVRANISGHICHYGKQVLFSAIILSVAVRIIIRHKMVLPYERHC